eukprot:scaffold8212_cov127-Skeletonema_menzelii.AAC.3
MRHVSTNEQKRSNHQQAKRERRGRLDDQVELLPLPLRRRHAASAGGRNFNQRKNNNQLGRRGIDIMGPVSNRSRRRRARQNMPLWSLGLSYQPGNGNLNRRGPIPDMEPLPGRRRHEPRLRIVPSDFNGALVSDEENEDEEEHEYLPNNFGNRNQVATISVDLVSDDDDDDA